MTITLYGIKTCGSVKKAIILLEKHSIPFTFIDLKTHTPSREQLALWIEQKGIKIVLNTKGTTYKNLKKDGKIADTILDSTLQIQIDTLFAVPMLLKRPIITSDESLIIGYDESAILNLIHIFQQRKL
ncbi:arsenate reductase family protein [Helicobacter sp. MIT 21-1697]|uniref:arsenate reductase family protein n=1 Tax=Helicobacter sp. MIT 21-1697 TaxID=2993733 RepID=UPI00224B2C18|nr:arsenate reductase family protein [Helicobacter sp. MIT 21-1697]MCX2716689.1 arsenate reductase family protein [Helicobacter sp. MIT 21-1697]